MHQTRARILRGDTHVEGKILSVFEPSTEIIRKGKAGKHQAARSRKSDHRGL
jgi:IS5 family transposase